MSSWLKANLPAPAARWDPERLQYLFDLLRVLVARELKLRYQRSVLGIAWSLVNPLVQIAVFSFIFRSVVPLGIQKYSAFVFTGLLVWNWFQSALLAGTGAIVENRDLVKRPGFPFEVLPAVTVWTQWIHFLLALPVLFGFLLYHRIVFTPALLLLPVLFAIQFAFSLGLIYFLATLHVTFRDTQHLLGLALMVGFYLSPVFYEVSAVPGRFLSLYQLNPLAILIGAYRAILLEGRLPPALPLAGLALLSALLITAGLRVYQQGRSRFVEEL